MLNRITDKLILLLTTTALVLICCTSVSASFVLAVILAFIIYGLGEITSSRLLFILLTVGAIGLKLIGGGVYTLLFPACTYALISSNLPVYIGELLPEKSHLRSRNSHDKILLGLSIGLIVALFITSFINSDILSLTIVTLTAIIIAAYISYKSVKYDSLNSKLTRAYDEARKTAINEQKQRKLLAQANANDIYTATLKERNRIAREIHDNVGHILTRTIVQMQAVLMINKDETTRPYLESINESINNAMTSIRKSVHELHDDSIDLSIELNELVNSLDKRFDVKLTTAIDSPASNELKTAIIAIVKEALTNIAKYSTGNQVRVEMVENVTFWRISVWDNGQNPVREYNSGLDLDREVGSGIGLENIITRAARLDGRAIINSDNTGFRILVTIPKKEDSHNDQSQYRR